MLVLAKNPDEVFRAPLKTKKQAPVTGGNRETQRGVSAASFGDLQHAAERAHLCEAGDGC